MFIFVVADREGVLLSFRVKAVGRLTYPLTAVESQKVLPGMTNPQEAAPHTASGAVYVVEAKGLGLVKIGMASDVPSRLRMLQNMSPARLTVLAAFYSANPASDEMSLHRRFAKDRQHGEWFAATDEITDWAWHDSQTGTAHRARAQAAVDAAWKRRLKL